VGYIKTRKKSSKLGFKLKLVEYLKFIYLFPHSVRRVKENDFFLSSYMRFLSKVTRLFRGKFFTKPGFITIISVDVTVRVIC
jgi:hypothetical protein